MKNPETYTIVVRPEGNGVPGIVRVRGLLKAALRQHGLRCVLISSGDKGQDTQEQEIER